VIADEVVTAFGKNAKPFGAEHWRVKPETIIYYQGLRLFCGAVAFSIEVWEAAKD